MQYVLINCCCPASKFTCFSLKVTWIHVKFSVKVTTENQSINMKIRVWESEELRGWSVSDLCSLILSQSLRWTDCVFKYKTKTFISQSCTWIKSFWLWLNSWSAVGEVSCETDCEPGKMHWRSTDCSAGFSAWADSDEWSCVWALREDVLMLETLLTERKIHLTSLSSSIQIKGHWRHHSLVFGVFPRMTLNS